MLLIGNIIPWNRPSLTGCFYWNWYICLDIQFFLLIPLLAKLWRRYRRKMEYALAVLLLLLIAADFLLLYFYSDYKVAVFSAHNTNMESVVAERPWGRLDIFVVGVLFAIVLLHIRDYRERKLNAL